MLKTALIQVLSFPRRWRTRRDPF